MNNHPNQKRIRDLKEQISECRDYISSDFCRNCMDMYKRIEIYEQELKYLEDQDGSLQDNG